MPGSSHGLNLLRATPDSLILSQRAREQRLSARTLPGARTGWQTRTAP
jgi:hypothetical protein